MARQRSPRGESPRDRQSQSGYYGPAYDDPMLWKDVLGATKRGGMRTLAYTLDILNRPTYAVGNLYRALRDKNPDEAVDVIRQFLPFGEAMERATGYDLAPNVKKTVGDHLRKWMIDNDYPEWAAGLSAMGTDILSDPTVYAGKYIPKGWAGAFGKSVSRSIDKSLDLMERIPGLRLAAGGGKKMKTFADDVARSLKLKFVPSVVQKDLETMYHSARGSLERTYGDTLDLFDEVLTGGDTSLVVHWNNFQRVDHSLGVGIYSAKMSDNARVMALSTLSDINSAPAKVLKIWDDTVSQLPVKPDMVVRMTTNQVGGRNAHSFLDQALRTFPDDVIRGGSLVSVESATGAKVATKKMAEVFGKHIAVAAPVIESSKHVTAVTNKLRKLGAKSVNFVTLGYADTLNNVAAMKHTVDAWKTVGKEYATIGRIWGNPRIQKAFAIGAQEPGINKAMVDFIAHGIDSTYYKGLGKGGKAYVREGSKLYRSAYNAIFNAETKGLSPAAKAAKRLNDPFLRGYVPNQLTKEGKVWIRDNFETYLDAIAKHLDEVETGNPALWAEMLKQGEGRVNASRQIDKLIRAGKYGKLGDDMAISLLDNVKKIADHDKVLYQKLVDTGMLNDIVEARMIAEHGFHFAMEPRSVAHLGLSPVQLNDVYNKQIEGLTGKKLGFNLWDEDLRRITAARSMRYVMLEAQKQVRSKLKKFAGKVLNLDELAGEYDEIVEMLGASTERQGRAAAHAIKATGTRAGRLPGLGGDFTYNNAMGAMIDAAQSEKYKVMLGGKALVLNSGEHAGYWLFPELAEVTSAAGMISGATPLFDPTVGRAVYELLKFNAMPGHAMKVANEMRGMFGAFTDWFSQEYRSSVLYFSPRRIFRDTFDDSVRGWFEFGNDFIVGQKDEFLARAAKNPNRNILGVDVDVNWLRSEADKYSVFGGGYGAQATGGQITGATSSLAEKAGISKAAKTGLAGIKERAAAPFSKNRCAAWIRKQVLRLDAIRRDAAVKVGLEQSLKADGIVRPTLDDIVRRMPQVADRIDGSLYIYSNLTPWEKGTASKFMLFYPFFRKNLPFWFRQITEHPARVAATLRVTHHLGVQESEEEKMWKKPWLTKSLNMKIGQDKAGRPVYMTGAGLSIEQLEQVLSIGRNYKGKAEAFLGMMHPLIRVPLEMASGKYFYFDMDIKDHTRAYETMNDIPLLRSFLKVKEVKDENGRTKRWAADANRLYLFQQMKPFMDAVQLADAAKSSLGMAKSRTQRSFATELTSFITGLNITTGDPELYSRVIQRNAMLDYFKQAQTRGEVGIFQTPYLHRGMELPKEQEAVYQRALTQYQNLLRR